MKISSAKARVVLAVTLVILMSGGAAFWLFGSARDGQQQVAPSPYADGARVTVQGEFMCLPHRNTDGPQTEECAFGMRADGKYYALRDSNADYSLISKGVTGERIKVTGTFEKQDSDIYPIAGLIIIDSLELLSKN